MPQYITKHMPVDDYPYIQYADEVDKEPETADDSEDDNADDDNEGD